MTIHELFCERAEEALSKVHGDTSVSTETTLSSLNGLREHLDMLIEAVEGDLAREDEPVLIGE